MNYYNEIDPYPAQWLRNLAAAGHIPPGTVDERSIADVRADDLVGYTQAHFFAGIGGWPYALRLAGWPDDRPVWTGSCPCQPFSAAGKGLGEKDARHLWPEFRRLIAESRPPTIFGEQVASAAGRDWLAAVRSDLQALDYAFWAVDLCGASVGAPHIRQRLFWVAHAMSAGRPERRTVAGDRPATWSGGAGVEGVANHGRMGDAIDTRSQGHGRPVHVDGEAGWEVAQRHGAASSPWAHVEYLPCSDGRSRPTQPGLFPLAYGIPARMGRLRAYGNAIVPQVGAVFVLAVMDCILQETK